MTPRDVRTHYDTSIHALYGPSPLCAPYPWLNQQELLVGRLGGCEGGNYKVAWDIVCRSMKLSRLGIHNLGLLNEALRVSWS